MDNYKERIHWLKHNGLDILFNDYKALKNDKITEAIKESEKQALSVSSSKIYVINDVTGSFMNSESTAAAKHWEQACISNGKKMFLALVGVTGIKRVLANVIKKDIYFAKNIDDAKNWLLNESKK